MLGFIFAILSPLVWALMNVIDKYVISRRVIKPLGYAALGGFVNLFLGLIFAIFSDWNFPTTAFISPAISGILLGSQFFFYYTLLSKEDISKVIGLIYVYPIYVAMLSYFFLGEKLSFIGYIGMSLIIIGAIIISGLKFGSKLFILSIIVAGYEFLIKITVINIPVITGMAIEGIFIGLTVISSLFLSSIRKDFLAEMKNYRWAFLTETMTFCGVLTTFFAMEKLSASIVSSIAAIQPMAVLFIELLFFKLGWINKSTKKRFLPLGLIVIGVIIIFMKS
jgi:drug/metabolite transporter (DMT)-like permease